MVEDRDLEEYVAMQLPPNDSEMQNLEPISFSCPSLQIIGNRTKARDGLQA